MKSLVAKGHTVFILIYRLSYVIIFIPNHIPSHNAAGLNHIAYPLLHKMVNAGFSLTFQLEESFLYYSSTQNKFGHTDPLYKIPR